MLTPAAVIVGVVSASLGAARDGAVTSGNWVVRPDVECDFLLKHVVVMLACWCSSEKSCLLRERRAAVSCFSLSSCCCLYVAWRALRCLGVAGTAATGVDGAVVLVGDKLVFRFVAFVRHVGVGAQGIAAEDQYAMRIFSRVLGSLLSSAPVRKHANNGLLVRKSVW